MSKVYELKLPEDFFPELTGIFRVDNWDGILQKCCRGFVTLNIHLGDSS